MVDPRLVDYIKKSLEQGFSEATIKSQLKKGRWGDKEINEAVGTVKTALSKPQPKKQSIESTKLKPEVQAESESKVQLTKLAKPQPEVKPVKPKPEETPKITQEEMIQRFSALKKEQGSEKEFKPLEEKKCPDCGTPYDEKEDFFCGECGKYLKEIKEEKLSIIKKRKEDISRLKKHLTPDEKILAMFVSSDNMEWYATTKRVIKFKKTLFQEKTASLPYNQISSLSLESSNYYWLLIIGGISFFIGLLYSSKSTFFALVLIISGIITFFVGLFLGKSTFYQFTGSGLDGKEWKVSYSTKQKEIEGFVQSVEKKLG